MDLKIDLSVPNSQRYNLSFEKWSTEGMDQHKMFQFFDMIYLVNFFTLLGVFKDIDFITKYILLLSVPSIYNLKVYKEKKSQ